MQQFDCVLAASSSDLLVGQYPDLKVTLRNRTQKGVLAVSSFGWLEIIDFRGNPVFSEQRRCGVEDCLRAEELAVIGGGQEFNPFGEGFPVTRYLDRSQVSRPGEYQLRYHSRACRLLGTRVWNGGFLEATAEGRTRLSPDPGHGPEEQRDQSPIRTQAG